MTAARNIICPLCNDTVDALLYPYHSGSERAVMARIKQEHPAWIESTGLCSRCMDYYRAEIIMGQRILPEIGPHFSIRSADDYIILPTGLRLNTHPGYTGKGVTICFIDSGFYPHNDLVKHRHRIKAYIDVTAPGTPLSVAVNEASWHGTMTSVVCAGDGYSSHGLYKGIASDADLVLIKTQDAAGKITTESITAALAWVVANHEEYGIQIVNMSLGDDTALPWQESKVDLLAEQLIQKGIVCIAAVGNDEAAVIKAPANAPHVIAVGGVNDENMLGQEPMKMYHSSFGRTADQLMKPDLLAPAIWIAAPILPGTKEETEAAALHYLLSLNNDALPKALAGVHQQVQLDNTVIASNDVSFIKQCIVQRIQQAKYISPAYMHVDGTSFAAPVVSAVVAQLLEANPALTPKAVRDILFSTAARLPYYPAERQGFGVVQPRRALIKALNRQPFKSKPISPLINKTDNCIEFYLHHDSACQVSLAGSFNNWAHDVLLMEPGDNAVWTIAIPMLPAGKYQYKFLVDATFWVEDIDNLYREPDGLSGFNSILTIHP